MIERYAKVRFLYAMEKLKKGDTKNLYVQTGGGLHPVNDLKVEYSELKSVRFFEHEGITK